jgi:hypothetical protein
MAADPLRETWEGGRLVTDPSSGPGGVPRFPLFPAAGATPVPPPPPDQSLPAWAAEAGDEPAAAEAVAEPEAVDSEAVDAEAVEPAAATGPAAAGEPAADGPGPLAASGLVLAPVDLTDDGATPGPDGGAAGTAAEAGAVADAGDAEDAGDAGPEDADGDDAEAAGEAVGGEAAADEDAAGGDADKTTDQTADQDLEAEAADADGVTAEDAEAADADAEPADVDAEAADVDAEAADADAEPADADADGVTAEDAGAEPADAAEAGAGEPDGAVAADVAKKKRKGARAADDSGLPPWAKTAAPGGPKAKPGRGKSRGRIVIVALALVLLVGLLGSAAFGIYHFDERAKPAVTVFGLDVTGQDEAQVTATVQDFAAGFTVPLVHDGRTVYVTAAELGVTVDVDESVAAVFAAGKGHMPWITYNPWVEKPAAAVIDVDEGELQDFLDSLFTLSDEETVEASVAYDDETGKFAATPSVTGTHADAAAVLEALTGFAAGERDLSEPIPVEDVTDPPVFTTAAAQAAADKANLWLAADINLNDGGDRSYHIPPASIASWTVITPEEDSGTFAVTFDRDKATADLETVLNEQVAIPMKPTIGVLDPRNPDYILGYEWGQDGSRVTDAAGVIVLVQDAILAGESLTYTVPLEYVAMTTVNELPPMNYDEPGGAKWIDVNKSTYTATAYEGTTPIASFIISLGLVQYETPSGTFYIYLKYDYQVMRGGTGTVEGRWEYVAPTTWVSYFNGDVAFHEAEWNTAQGTWGTRASHGCVNMHAADAYFIYTWAPIGTMVYVHY